MLSKVINTIAFTILSCIYYFIHKWRNPKCVHRKLPPGSMGLPIVGETFQFFYPYSNLKISPFIAKRMQRYGSLFKTSLVGHPVVVSTDHEINQFVFQQEGKSVISSYVEYMDNIIATVSSQGPMHKYLRNLILNLFGNESMKSRLLLPQIEDHTSHYLHLWSTQSSVELKEAISTMLFSFCIKKMFSREESVSLAGLKHCYGDFLYGLVSFPLPIAGTAHWKCLQGRKKATKMIQVIMEERVMKPNKDREDLLELDFLDYLLYEMMMKKDHKFGLGPLFLLPLAFVETNSSALTLAIQFLVENPSTLQQLTEEHEAILKNRRDVESGITWEEYKSMTFTHMVINETIRLANIVPAIFRKALEDITIKGYTIPKGWTIMVCPPAEHLNPKIYDDPNSFNPWRWGGKELHFGSKEFMGFGGETRLCAGADYVKVQMAIFLHHLVTKYRWSAIKGGNVTGYPELIFPKGFHVQFKKRS